MNDQSVNTFYEDLGNQRANYETLVLDWMRAAFDIVNTAVSEKMYIPNVSDWPSISFSKNGLPSFSTYGKSPKDYSKIFSPINALSPYGGNLSMKNMDEFINLKNFLFESEAFVRKFHLTTASDFDDVSIQIFLQRYIQEYCNKYGLAEFDREKAKDILNPYANFVFNQKLKGTLIIPILLLDFECEAFQITDEIDLIKLSESDHLSRYSVRINSSLQKNRVIDAATHAFTIKNIEIDSTEGYFEFGESLKALSQQYSWAKDKLLAALRINKPGYFTGFAQVLVKPENWCPLYASLEHNICGVTVNHYPLHLDDGMFWNMEREVVQESELDSIKSSFSSMKMQNSSKYQFAIHRFNYANDRTDSRDRVVDAVIGLEALFGGNEKTEITHKLSMRAGALIGKFGDVDFAPNMIFRYMKKIYAYRSAVVHGQAKAERKRKIEIDDNSTTDADWLALEFLGETLRILGEYEKYLDPSIIDAELLLQQND